MLYTSLQKKMDNNSRFSYYWVNNKFNIANIQQL